MIHTVLYITHDSQAAIEIIEVGILLLPILHIPAAIIILTGRTFPGIGIRTAAFVLTKLTAVRAQFKTICGHFLTGTKAGFAFIGDDL